MKKKLLVLCLVVMFVLPATVFAGSFLGLKVGAAAVLNEPINLENIEETDFSEIGLDSFSFGADIRFNVSVVEVAALVLGQVYEEGALLYGHVGLGASLELLGLVDLGITAGPWLAAEIWEGEFYPYFDPEDFESFPLTIRATADVNLGGISVGGFVMVNPGVTIGELMDPGFDPASIEVDTTALAGLSVLIALL